MKVTRQKQVEGTERDVKFEQGTSLRYVLASDGMGFSVNQTIIPKGEKGHWHYKNHLEACYCVKGSGILTNLETGEKHPINEHDCYSLDNNDDHTFESLEDVILISIFNPPLTGREVHRKDGSYEVNGHYNKMAKSIVQSVNCSNNYKDSISIVTDILIAKN